MAGKLEIIGVDELVQMFSQLADQAPSIAAQALYEGAGVMADEYSKAISSIKTEPFKYATNGRKRYASPAEKSALDRKVGIAKFIGDGTEVDTLVGEPEGYANVAGERKAVRLIARSINSGTSFMIKQPVFRKAQSTGRTEAKKAVVKAAEDMIKELIK